MLARHLLVASSRRKCFSTLSGKLFSTATATMSTGTRFVPISRILSSNEISQRVQKRVDERESWDGKTHMTIPEVAKFIWNHWREMLFPPVPSSEELDRIFPVQKVDFEKLRSPPKDEIQVTWIGHSTLLVQMGECNILTDPIFSERCSAFQFAGPQRYRPPACLPQDLIKEEVPIHMVLISHNHFDHLDYNSVKQLSKQGNIKFVVPLGIKSWLSWYIPDCIERNEVVELDWHEQVSIGGLQVRALPMKHWSTRTIWDRDSTLWCGFGISNDKSNFLFPGDTAWFDGLSDIGKKYGPFDLAAVPIGAYEPQEFMQNNHVNPLEAVRMFDAVRAKKAVPIHYGCFPLTFEPVMEPAELLVKHMEGRDKSSFAPWFIGETVTSSNK